MKIIRDLKNVKEFTELSTIVIGNFDGVHLGEEIKIFQTEEYENKRLTKIINSFKEKVVKIQTVMTRATPIMETLTGLMIGGLIYYSGNLIIKDELELNNFF